MKFLTTITLALFGFVVLRAEEHWAFRPLKPAAISSIDQFIGANLKSAGLRFSGQADRQTLIRRVAFILTGLPPTPEEIQQFHSDRKRGAYERMVDRYLASPRYGEHWGRIWLDAAGYADSNGYFQADTDRPFAWRYRDYAIRSFNRDKPFDQFVREQIAGDELSGWKPGQPATPEIIELLEATHYLRNAQDGSGESDGNPDEVRSDRYYALESQMQIMGSSLLGLTIQCAKCHDHKFEPITQKDYYAFQAFLYPAYNIEKWTKPQDRIAQANLPGELEAWQSVEKKLDEEAAALKRNLSDWIAANRPEGKILFKDDFSASSLAANWSNTAPGDNAPGGATPVTLDSEKAPGAFIRDGQLRIVESGASGDRWISTKRSFQWKPATKGEWIQATFDLVKDAERVGYFIALHDFDHSSGVAGGNVLIDGNPSGNSGLHLGYPGAGSKSIGEFTGHYKAGRNYGVRVTKIGDDKFSFEHLIDGAVDGKAIELKGENLPEGGFGFEYCCGRSFIVDSVVIESSNAGDPEWAKRHDDFQKAVAEKKNEFEKQTKEIAARRTPKPGRIAWMPDASANAPEVKMLKRGNHKTPGEKIDPLFPVLFKSAAPRVEPTSISTGRRLAWARWITETNSPQAALLARVAVNRIWQNIFGVGIVSTPDNLGVSGAKPTHPELLEFLAAEFARSGWKQKSLLKSILISEAFRQQSLPNPKGLAADPNNHLLWRFPIQRLPAESIRDAMLSISARLDSKSSGPYVPTPREGSGEVMPDESKPEAFARSVFLQHRRTQVPTFLASFDAPSVVFNCTHRMQTTQPLQSLSLLNSDFSVKRAEDLSKRLQRDCGSDAKKKIDLAYRLVAGRTPEKAEQVLAGKFLATQQTIYADKSDADERSWADFCQTLLASNHFLYIQ